MKEFHLQLQQLNIGKRIKKNNIFTHFLKKNENNPL